MPSAEHSHFPEQYTPLILLASQSAIARYRWQERGVAPLSYIKGMALVYARVYCTLKRGDLAATDMAQAQSMDPNKDALAWYEGIFSRSGMTNATSGVDTLRHLFVLLIGLGMRESSGQYCAGRDASAENVTAETAEAGLFQASYNACSGSPLMLGLFHQYAGSTLFLDVFSEGVKCKAPDLENYGEGEGREFQRLTKACPAFAAEFAALGLRHLRKHWGPINTRAVEIRTECDKFLKDIQESVDELDLCSKGL